MSIVYLVTFLCLDALGFWRYSQFTPSQNAWQIATYGPTGVEHLLTPKRCSSGFADFSHWGCFFGRLYCNFNLSNVVLAIFPGDHISYTQSES